MSIRWYKYTHYYICRKQVGHCHDKNWSCFIRTWMVPFLIAGHILLMWYHNLVTTLWPHCDNLVLTVIKIFVKDNEFYCVHGPLYIYVYRLVVDEWLELKFPSPETGQGVLSAVQTLRSMWSHLLEMKLQASQCESSNTSIKELAHNHARN